MTREEKIEQAEREGNIDYCPNCKKKQPVELTFYDPDADEEESLIQCLICGEGITLI